jgi:hypothetical protein
VVIVGIAADGGRERLRIDENGQVPVILDEASG